jgi:CheY-like chemotaxis protein
MPQSVLVVEDDPLLRMCTAEMISECGFEVLEAEDADRALEVLAAEADHIVVLVTDVRMPGQLDGVALANFVTKNWPNIRVLVTSGFDDGRRQQLAEGVRFLPKPWRALDVITYVMTAKAEPDSTIG